ncbi:hypothetical protein [Nitratidesulfovibrio sp. 1201_IL3209]|uniref:hypothetical protein n=1 Tax=Nitratidesulfovibrio sp. 1201_IL3209 TaxID=3084053 RepID=UPI002FD884CB
MNDDRLYRAIERIDERTARLAEGHAALAARVDERFDSTDSKLDAVHDTVCRHDEQLADHAQTITSIRTVAKVGGWLGTVGGAAGVWGMIKGFFAGAQ